jgi:putative exporter of polyketide antibiotics
MGIAAVGSSKQLFIAAAFAAIGIAIAFGGTEAMLWLVQRFPTNDQTIRQLGAWTIGVLVCVTSVYPILVVYGIVRRPHRQKR